VVLSPAVDWIRRIGIGRWRPSRGIAIVAMAAGAVVMVTLMSFFAAPPVVSQAKELAAQFPDLLEKLRDRLGPRFQAALDPASISAYIASHVPVLARVFGSIAGAIASTATVFILTAYLTLEGERVLHWSMSLFPAQQAERLEPTLRRAGIRIRHWLTGQIMLMLILGTGTAVVLGAMQIRFFYLLAIFAGVANFIPFLGPIATVILAGSMAAVDSLWKALGVLIFYAVYQQIESAFLTPKIMQSQVRLSASAVLISLLLGSAVAGIVGALVAVPSAALAATLLNEYMVRSEAS
jgi:predicted PurR-regulated permease PerM